MSMANEDLQETENFGFTRIGEGEPFEKNGWAFTDADRTTLDDLLHALENHTHSAEPRLADPDGAPSLALVVDGGILPPDTTLYYQVAWVDQWGLETASSLEADLTTPGEIDSPTSPLGTVETASGTLGVGTYGYVITAVSSDGGETTGSARTDVPITSGSTNRIQLTMPELPVGAVSFRVYRSRPGQGQLYYLTETSQASIYDDGSVLEDSTITLPGYNTTNNSSAVEVTVPGGVIPAGVVAWRLYRSLTPGVYDGYNLVAEVTEGALPTDTVPKTTYIDTGENLLLGMPREKSATVSGGRVVDLSQVNGKFPLNSMPRGARRWDLFASGGLVVGKVYAKTEALEEGMPVSLSAFFVGTAPGTAVNGAQIAFEVSDAAGNSYLVASDGVDNEYLSFVYPLTDGGSFEAEGSLQEGKIVVDDAEAYNGQAVELSGNGDTVDVVFGDLDAGSYNAYVRLRSVGATPPSDDLTIAVINNDIESAIVVDDHTVVEQPGGVYYEIGPIPFVAPGAVEIGASAVKATAGSATYHVDRFRYELQQEPLAAGTWTVSATLADPPGTAAPTYVPTPSGVHFTGVPARIYVRETIDTEAVFTFATSDSSSVSWTALSDQTWCVPSPSSATNSTDTVTCSITFGDIAVGGRGVAQVSLSASGVVTSVVEIVVLRVPAVTGTDANVSIQY